MAFKDIFERESRDSAFAPVLEQRIHDALLVVFHELQLEGRVHAMHTSCRTLSCLTTIEVAKSEGELVYNEINGILLGDGQNPELVDKPDAALSEIKIYNIYRGENVMQCLEGVHLAGAEKIRFAVDVVSTPLAATTGRWRFVEIADGEPLPDSFASCAARALGGGQRVVPPEGFRFPQYTGDLLILYTIPAPASE